MLKKIISIKNIGVLKDCYFNCKDNFDKVNIIYGYNGEGKSTVCAIIRSCIEGKLSLITERKSYYCKSNDEISCDILCRENSNNCSYKFQNDSWNDNLKNTIIYDSYFIDNCIHTGLNIHSDHQKGLYEFAIGEEGVFLSKRIEEIKIANKKLFSKLDNKKVVIRALAKNKFSIEEYILLKKEPEIDAKIEIIERKIGTAKVNDEIKKKEKLYEIDRINTSIDFKELKTLLEKTIKNVSTDSSEKAKKYLDKLNNTMEGNAEEWLQQGLNNYESLTDNKCPFCQKELFPDDEIIIIYNNYFNREFKNYKIGLTDFSNRLGMYSIDIEIQKIENIANNNNSLMEFWKNHLEVKEYPFIDFKDSEENTKKDAKKNLKKKIKEDYLNIKLTMENKLKKILDSVKTNSIDDFLKSLEEINNKIYEYNIICKNINNKIYELKNKQPNLVNLKNEKESLEIKKERFEEKNENYCRIYDLINKKIKRNQEQVTELSEKLKKDINSKIEIYGESVNGYLEKFGLPFKIVNAKSKYKGTSIEPYLDYYLQVKENKINPLQKARYVLSDGDKNSLALSFFFARLDVEQDIKDKVVILDDPVSSLDRNRRMRTIECIKDFSSRCSQIIVLTHYDIFAFKLYEDLSETLKNIKTFQIKNSKINNWDIAEESKHQYFQDIDKLEKFCEKIEILNNRDAEYLIRKVLENALKFRYFQHFKNLGSKCWLRPMIEELKKISQTDPAFKFRNPDTNRVFNELDNLCDFSNTFHHANSDRPYRDINTYDEPEIRNYAQSTLELVFNDL